MINQNKWLLCSFCQTIVASVDWWHTKVWCLNLLWYQVLFDICHILYRLQFCPLLQPVLRQHTTILWSWYCRLSRYGPTSQPSPLSRVQSWGLGPSLPPLLLFPPLLLPSHPPCLEAPGCQDEGPKEGTEELPNEETCFKIPKCGVVLNMTEIFF